MNLTAICLFSVVFCLAAEFSSAQWNNRNFNYGLGNRHSIGLGGYNYRGNRWNTNVRHNPFNSQTSLNANYRRNHNFNVGHNWRNRQTNLGYTWKFGKRRRSIDIQDEVLEFLKIEHDPKAFQKKLQLAVNMFIKTYHYQVPELEILSVSVPDYQVTNVTVAQEIVCVVRKLQKILPNSLGNFKYVHSLKFGGKFLVKIVKMIKYHGRTFDIESLGDFFSVDPVQEAEIEYQESCEVPEIPASSELVDGARLVEMKKFVATLITAAMEYQQMLEA